MNTTEKPVWSKGFRRVYCAVYTLLCLLYVGGWWLGIQSIGKPPWCELQPWLGDKPEITDCDWFNGHLSVTVKAAPQQVADYAAALQLEQGETEQDGTVHYASPGPCRLRTQEGRVSHESVDITMRSSGGFCTVTISSHFEPEGREPRTIPARFPYRDPWLEDLPSAWVGFFDRNTGLADFISGIIMLCVAMLYLGPCLLVDGALLLRWRRPPHGFWRWAAWLLLPLALLGPALLLHLASLPEWDLVAIIVTMILGLVLGGASVLGSLLLGFGSRLLPAADKKPA